MLTVEQFAAVNKANLDVLFGLTEKSFASVEKLAQLNVAAGKAALNESATHAQALLKVKDVQELLALQTEALQPVGEKVSSYSRHVYDIAVGTQAEFTKAVGLTLDLTARGMGVRSNRYSMLVKDGKVAALNIEGPGKFEVSDADTMLAQAKG